MTKKPAQSESPLEQCINEARVLAHELPDDVVFPNSRLPLLLYRGAVALHGADPAALLEQLFASYAWRGSWRNGIYAYHHYHSTAHEVLGVYCGSAKVQLGGDNGLVEEVTAGDVLIIPAGVAHKNLGATADLGVVGAYDRGREWDMNYGKPGERPNADVKIARVPLPQMDPVYGAHGPLLEKWRVPEG